MTPEYGVIPHHPASSRTSHRMRLCALDPADNNSRPAGHVA